VIKGVAYSRWAAVTAGAAIVAAVMSLLWHAETTRMSGREIILGQMQDREAAERVAAESEFDEVHLQGLREKVSLFRVRLGDEGTWAKILGRLGSGWSVDRLDKAERLGYSVQYGTFRMTSPEVSDWQSIIETVRFVEGLPGAGIGEFEMRSSGDGVQRSLSLVSMVVVVHSRSPERR
jgi:hypothetical protein